MKAASNKIKITKKSNVIYISSYKKRNIVKPYTKTDDSWYKIKRADSIEKAVSFKAARLIGKLILELHKSNDHPVYKDNHWFSKIIDVHSSMQNARIRNQINHIFNFSFHKRIVVDGILLKDIYKISFSENAYAILNFEDVKSDIKNSKIKTPDMAANELLYINKNVVISQQKCCSHIDNKVIEDIPKGYLSMTNNKKLKIKSFKKPEFSSHADCLLAQPAQDEILSESKQPVPKCDSLNQPNIQKEIYIMKQEDTVVNDRSTRQMLLSKALWNNFGAAANEIHDNCTFEELEPDKVGIKSALGVSFNDIEKAKIRKCIKSIYGEGVKILAASHKPIAVSVQKDRESWLAKNEAFGSGSQNNSQWLRFKADLTKILLKKHEEKIVHHIVKNWFDKLHVDDNSTSQNLILIGSVFAIQWIDDKFGMELENAVLASNLTVELRDEANRNRPLIFSKKTIKRDN